MIWLLSAGDTDILRDATNPSAIFWDRARKGRKLLMVAAVLTLLLLLSVVLLILGPDGTGISWASRDAIAVEVSIIGVIWLVFCGWVFFKFLPGRNDRVVIGLRRFVRGEVDPLEERIRGLSDEQLRAKTDELKGRLAGGETPEQIRPEAYACVREASRRARNHRQFECQLIGGKVIENCNVAEMRTGEGKTIVCYMANYMKVLQGLKVHMVTVNDYLVERDANFCKPIFELLGVSVGFIRAEMPTFGAGVEVRRAAYACDITYGTNSEFGFDYLRDNMKFSTRDQVQGRQDFVVVDEVDSILIDEARTPLIISGPAHDDVGNYRIADNIAQSLIRKQKQANAEMARRIDDVEANPTGEQRNNNKFKPALKKFRADPYWLSSDEAEAIGHTQYFVVEADRKSVHMTEHGAKAAQQELGVGSFYDSKNMNWPHYIDNALRAHLVYNREKEYVVQDDVIIIVDEFTGRMMHGRQWSDGLHQAVEAKERVTIKQETQTLATITLQNLFKLYKQLAGMTGTAMTESDEFMKIYQLEVIAIPTNKPIRRFDHNDKIYKTGANKFEEIVEEIRSFSQKGYASDPFSLAEELRTARRYLRETQRLRPDDAEVQSRLAMVDDALAGSSADQVDEVKLEEGYRKILGDKAGGRPVLVGTVSVESSEKLSEHLRRKYGIEHEVLNAKNHAREAEIVAKAGQQHESTRNRTREMHGNVTIATNMAGRGTDIVLGPGVAAIGGLHVVGTERHESRRIDNQLRGRCGRQGDPGSTRFFLSLEDDLLRLFMGEWLLKVLSFMGFKEGMALEDRQLTRGIANAQKKVEERNFNIRKSLLEYDEVMNHQRKAFYGMRQDVVEGRGLSDTIWQMIDDAVSDAAQRYYDPQYAASCVAEWASQHLGAAVDAGKLDTRDYEGLCEQVRDLAENELRTSIQRTFGEYVDPGVPTEEWDLRGLAAFAAPYGLNLTQRQIKETDPDALLDQIIEAAIEKMKKENLSPLQQYVDPLFGKARLVRWASEKFGVQIPLDDVQTLPREDAEKLIVEKMRAAYKIREIEYPAGAVLEFAIQRGGQNVNEVYARIAGWVNRKFGLEWSYEHFAGKQPKQIFDELRDLNGKYISNGLLDAEIDRAIAGNPGPRIVDWARQRFGQALEGRELSADAPDLREQLRQCAYEMLRYELTQVERYVLLNTYDALWKDHMYAIDLLRHSIGLRGYAERDPKIEYKREATRMFNEMQSNIRERVTDLIFKVNIAVPPMEGGDSDGGGVPAATAAGGGGGLAYANVQTAKADATNAGFGQVDADRAAAMRNQGQDATAVEPIKRAMPRVGRNDPCPCGSGKKYKSCHGKTG